MQKGSVGFVVTNTNKKIKLDRRVKTNIRTPQSTAQYGFNVQVDDGSYDETSFLRNGSYRIKILIYLSSNALSTVAHLLDMKAGLNLNN